jgi:hypothetical protein
MSPTPQCVKPTFGAKLFGSLVRQFSRCLPTSRGGALPTRHPSPTSASLFAPLLLPLVPRPPRRLIKAVASVLWRVARKAPTGPQGRGVGTLCSSEYIAQQSTKHPTRMRALATSHYALVTVLMFLLSPLVISHQSLLDAQSETASLSGVIQDPKGGVVPDVEVTVTRIETGTVATTKTNGAGIYSFPSLQPGHYHLVLQKPGFKEIAIKDFELHTQDKSEQNFSLEIGSVSETVTVSADSININTTDATVSTTIDRNFAENLPLNGRSFQTLVLLTPGTLMVGRSGSGTNAGTSGDTDQFSVNGQRSNSNSFTVDGVSVNLGGNLSASNPGQATGANPSFTIAGTTQGMVSVDALQEFKVQTSTYAPEFGRQPGGQVSLLTRSGTNDFHGTAFDYFRNTVLDANNWFNDQQGLPKGVERQNDFGGTLGGPILKNKTFFFFSYEGLRLLVPKTQNLTVPSIRLRQEAASAYQSILGSWPIPVLPEETIPNPGPCTPPVVPCPPIPTGAAPYTLSQSAPSNIDSYSVRVDQTLGTRAHLFGRYSDTSSDSGLIGIPTTGLEKLRGRALTLGTDVAIRPTFSNELRLNYSVNVSTLRNVLNLVGGAKAFDESVLFPKPLVGGADAATWELSLPRSDFAITSGSQGKYSQRQINLIDSVSYSIGSHQIRSGVDYRRLFPILGTPALGAYYGIFSESELKAGNVSFSNASASLVAHPIYTNFSAFGQDTWRVSNRLTLTYGLRWELNPAPGERDGLQPFNVIGLNDPATATLAPLNSKLYTTTYNNFAPRIGVAYQVRQSAGRETVIRGGFGVFYDLNSEASAIGFGAAPFGNAGLPATNAPFPFAPGTLQIPTVPTPATPPFSEVWAIDPNLKLPYTLQWNISLEQALGRSQSFTTSYVAGSGYRLLRTSYLFNPNMNLGTIFDLQNASSSNYQSLQLQFNRRLSQGLQALVAYTYSHSIDDASDGLTFLTTAPSGTAFVNPNIDRGNSDFDLRHAFRAGITYNIPLLNRNFLTKAVFGGWSTDAIALAQSSLPVDLLGNFYLFPGIGVYELGLRPNVVRGLPLYLYGTQCAQVFGPVSQGGNGSLQAGQSCPGGMGFNPAAFLPVPADANGLPTQTEGDLGRNVMRGFGIWQVDFAIHRQFNLTERINLQFRGEFFNLFNHPNFASPSGNLQFGFGLAGATLNNSLTGLNSLYQIGGPRSIQLALKLSF